MSQELCQVEEDKSAESEQVEKIIGKCQVCKLNIVKYSFHDIEPYISCSDFCAQSSDKEKILFLTAKPGDWILFPCEDCGVCLEDEWQLGNNICSACSSKRKSKLREDIISLQNDLILDLLPLTKSNADEALKIHSKLEQINILKNKL